jgi:hypothetical protein
VSRKDSEQEAERRRRLAATFGDPLPEATGDERPEAWGDGTSSRGGADDDEWLRSQVPPHHD